MDADDAAHPERLAKQFGFLKSNQDIDVLATQVEFISDLEHHEGYRSYVDWQNELLTHERIMLKRFVDAPIVQPTTMIRKSAFNRFGLYSEEGVPEDFELWLRWAHKGARFAKLPEILHTWYDSQGRLSRAHPSFSSEAFDRVKAHWLTEHLKLEHPGKPIIALGTSKISRERAYQLTEFGIPILAFSDVSGKEIRDQGFIPPEQLKEHPEAIIISFISQRGTGDRIAAFLEDQGLQEGIHFLLAA